MEEGSNAKGSELPALSFLSGYLGPGEAIAITRNRVGSLRFFGLAVVKASSLSDSSFGSSFG